MNDDITFELGADIIVNTDDTITIDTSAWDDSFTTSPTSIYTTTGNVNINASDYTYSSILDNMIDPEQVEHMSEHYPALSKVWRNFKSVYDMTLQDYKGKKEQGEFND